MKEKKSPYQSNTKKQFVHMKKYKKNMVPVPAKKLLLPKVLDCQKIRMKFDHSNKGIIYFAGDDTLK